MSAPCEVIHEEPVANEDGGGKHWSFAWHGLHVGTPLASAESPPLEDWSAKEEAIMACLQGNEEETVHLWQLRELALSKGGLVSSDCRKRAWPKLVAAHQVLRQAPSPTHGLRRSQVNALRTDLRTTVWNVEGELRRRKEERQREQAQLEALQEAERLRHKRVTFDPVVHYKVRSPSPVKKRMDSSSPPDAIETTPTNSQDNEDEVEDLEDDVFSQFSQDNNVHQGGTLSPSTVATQETAFTFGTTLSTSSSRAVRGRRATLSEQRILYTLITNLLQTERHYVYHAGFPNLVALLLYNLESPTVTSLVVSQLAFHHWRFLLSPKSQLEGFLSATFVPLLEHFDARLAQHLQNQGMHLPTFARSWIASWFASDTAEAPAASRLLDVLLVSHPLMIVYLCVAWVTSCRRQLLDLTDFVVLAKALRKIPLQGSEMNDHGRAVEVVVAQALKYMEGFPPDDLQTRVRNLQGGRDVWQVTVPAWLTTDYALTDTAFLAQRDLDMSTQPAVDVQADYPLAAAAVGPTRLPPSSRRYQQQRRQGLWRSLLAVLVVALLGAVIHQYGSLWQRTFLSPIHHLPAQLVRPRSSSRRLLAAPPSIASSTAVAMRTTQGGTASFSYRPAWWQRIRRALGQWWRWQLWGWVHPKR